MFITMMALMIGKEKGLLSEERFGHLIGELNDIPSKIEKILEQNDEFRRIAEIYKDTNNALYLGRGVSFPVALEGALKLKEISYIHAEGYPAAEMKHGPIALIDENIRAAGFDPMDISAILVSHAHFDHAGGVAALQRYTGAAVYTSAAGAQVLESGILQVDDPQFGHGPV